MGSVIPKTKAQKQELAREKALGEHIRATAGELNPDSLARSYGVPVKRVSEILKLHGRI